MVLLLLGISVVVFVVGLLMICKDFDEDFCVFVIGASLLLFITCLIATIILGVEVSKLTVIDEQFAMYQEENTKIEEQIATVVTQYQQYEKDIFTECTPETSVTLVSLYPDLKSDTLVQQQITLYVENNKKIKELKEKEINGDVTRWWLYFGGSKKGEQSNG